MTELLIELPARADRLDDLMAFLQRFWQAAALPEPGMFPFELALEELFMNVAMHGSVGAAAPRTVTCTAQARGTAVQMILQDDGIPFDPLQMAPVPDIEAPIEDRPIGGLGVYLVKELMDRVTYQRIGDRNVLTLVKDVSG